MATQTVNLPYDTSTSANYKSIMMQFGIALLAFGWVQTADTGTVSWAGISTLPGNGVYRDWEIWRMADTAQGTNPIFMKLEYSTQGTNAPIIRITIGTSSNGSGTITGTILWNQLLIQQNLTTSLGAANLFACFYAGGPGYFVCLLWEGAAPTNANAVSSWSIERSKDSTGADTDEFVVSSGINHNGGSKFSKAMTKTGLVTSDEGAIKSFLSSSGTNNFNGTTAACPQFMLVGKLSNPLLNYAVVPVGDAGEGATVNVNIYGASHTYIATKAKMGSNTNGFNAPEYSGAINQSDACTLVRFE